jgi:hypothetical protein
MSKTVYYLKKNGVKEYTNNGLYNKMRQIIHNNQQPPAQKHNVSIKLQNKIPQNNIATDNNNIINFLLKNNKILLFPQATPISNRILIRTLDKNPSQIYRNIYNFLKDKYSYIIPVRGDGHCYYRSIIFSLLYSILFQAVSIPQKNKYLNKLKDIFTKISDTDIYKNKNILGEKYRKFKLEDIISFFDNLISNNYISESYIDFLVLYNNIDQQLIYATKIILGDYISKNLDQNLNGLTIQQHINIQKKHINYDAEEFINNDILGDEDAEGFYINASLLPINCLKSKLSILFTFALNNTSSVNIGQSNKNENELPLINIYLYGGHYNVLIPKNVFINRIEANKNSALSNLKKPFNNQLILSYNQACERLSKYPLNTRFEHLGQMHLSNNNRAKLTQEITNTLFSRERSSKENEANRSLNKSSNSSANPSTNRSLNKSSSLSKSENPSESSSLSLNKSTSSSKSSSLSLNKSTSSSASANPSANSSANPSELKYSKRNPSSSLSKSVSSILSKSSSASLSKSASASLSKSASASSSKNLNSNINSINSELNYNKAIKFIDNRKKYAIDFLIKKLKEKSKISIPTQKSLFKHYNVTNNTINKKKYKPVAVAKNLNHTKNSNQNKFNCNKVIKNYFSKNT